MAEHSNWCSVFILSPKRESSKAKNCYHGGILSLFCAKFNRDYKLKLFSLI